MPSRPISPNPSSSPPPILKSKILFTSITISATFVIIITVIYIVYHIWNSLFFQRPRTRPFDSLSSTLGTPLKLRKFTYRELKSATNGFSPDNAIGKGGSGAVFRGILRDGKSVAVKRIEDPSSSLQVQVEKEFQNELTILGGIRSTHIVTLLGYCVDNNKRILVYEYMPNRSLQELLFCDDNSLVGVISWDRRFQIIQDVAQALEFLHNDCDPPVIHGDVKPSNVLLDWDFRAKVSDFGLSRVKLEAEEAGNVNVEMFSQDLLGCRSQDLMWKSQDLSGNLGAETPTPPLAQGSHGGGDVDFALALQASTSARNCGGATSDLETPGLMDLSNCMVNGWDEAKGTASPKGKHILRASNDDELCGGGGPGGGGSAAECCKELELNPSPTRMDDWGGKTKQWGKDWWWKQDGSGELCSKQYVMEWIGCQTTRPDWVGLGEKAASPIIDDKLDKPSTSGDLKECPPQKCGQLGHHLSSGAIEHMDKECKKMQGKKQPKKMQEWWKEENLEEMDSKNGSRKKSVESRLKKRRFKALHIHLGRCFYTLRHRKPGEANGDLRSTEFRSKRGRSRRKKHDRAPSRTSDMSGDLLSRELSSTTSMRGTLCYIAPEYGGCGFLMEKTDIYSLGVLILVSVSGRRPLHVLNSPMELEKANLISYCRQLAQAGNILELVDERLRGVYNKEQAMLCINLALACLQRMPELRPDIGDIVRILRGEMDLPPLPFEFSPSPPSRILSRSRRKKQQPDAE